MTFDEQLDKGSIIVAQIGREESLTVTEKLSALDELRKSSVDFAKKNGLVFSASFGAFLNVYYNVLSMLGFPIGPEKK